MVLSLVHKIDKLIVPREEPAIKSDDSSIRCVVGFQGGKSLLELLLGSGSGSRNLLVFFCLVSQQSF